MGADNWGVCPRCEKNHQKEIEKRNKALAAAYGKLPVDEFLALKKDTEDFTNKEPEQTLREDYGIGTEADGKFSVGYRCSCKTCGFTFNFEHTEQLKT